MLMRQFLMEWKLYSRDRAAMFWTFAFPILMLLGFGTIFKDSSGPQVKVVRVLGGGESTIDATLKAVLEEQHVKVEDLGREEAEARWKDGKMPVLLEGRDGARILNDVVLNQVLVRFGDDDALTADVVRRVQEDGTCWLSGTTWQGVGAMRISVSNWRTTADDVERSVDAILRCARAASLQEVQ